MKGHKFSYPSYNEDVICMANGRLEGQDERFFCSGIRALEKRWTKCISVAGDCV